MHARTKRRIARLGAGSAGEPKKGWQAPGRQAAAAGAARLHVPTTRDTPTTARGPPTRVSRRPCDIACRRCRGGGGAASTHADGSPRDGMMFQQTGTPRVVPPGSPRAAAPPVRVRQHISLNPHGADVRMRTLQRRFPRDNLTDTSDVITPPASTRQPTSAFSHPEGVSTQPRRPARRPSLASGVVSLGFPKLIPHLVFVHSLPFPPHPLPSPLTLLP